MGQGRRRRRSCARCPRRCRGDYARRARTSGSATSACAWPLRVTRRPTLTARAPRAPARTAPAERHTRRTAAGASAATMCEAGSTRRARARPNAAESAEEGASPPRLSDEVFALRTGPTPPAVSTAIVAAPRARSRGRRSERSGARNGPKESPKRAARGAHERRHHHPLRPAPTAGDSSETSVASRAPAPPMTKHHARPQTPHGGAQPELGS